MIEAGREFKVLAENELGAGFMASPAADGDALILRSRSHLYRIEEAPVGAPGGDTSRDEEKLMNEVLIGCSWRDKCGE